MRPAACARAACVPHPAACVSLVQAAASQNGSTTSCSSPPLPLPPFKSSLHVHCSPQPDAVRFSDLGGLSDKISDILDWIETPLKRPEDMRRLGAPLPKGLLIYGPSGVGKTKLVRALAYESKCFSVMIAGD